MRCYFNQSSCQNASDLPSILCLNAPCVDRDGPLKLLLCSCPQQGNYILCIYCYFSLLYVTHKPLIMFNFSTGSLSTLKPAYDKFNKCDSDRQNRRKAISKTSIYKHGHHVQKITFVQQVHLKMSQLCFVKQYCRPTDIL